MKRFLMHIGIAIICTTIGAFIWMYRANLLFPVEPVDFEPEKQFLKSSDMLEPDEMLEDFAYMVEVIESVHPDPYNLIGEKEWGNKKKTLRDKIKDPLTVAEYYFALKGLIISLGDAHTLLRFEEADKGLPLSFDWVEEGLVILEDYGEFNKGDLILKIGDKEPLDLLHHLDRMVSSENIYWVKNDSKRLLQKRSVLEYLDLVENDTVLFSIDRNGEVFKLTSPFEVKRSREEELEEIIADRHGWYIDQDNNLALFYVKVCFNDEEFKKEVEDFFAAVKRSEIENVIIDVRENIGGDSRVMEAFMRQLPIDRYITYGTTIRYSELAAKRAGMRRTKGASTYPPSTRRVEPVEDPFQGNVFILTGNQTFSSGNWIAVVFYDNDLGTVIGEPTGNAPSSFGDMLSFQLPNTRFVLGVSHKNFIRPDPSNDPINSLYPHVIVNKTREDIINDSDPMINYIKENL